MLGPVNDFHRRLVHCSPLMTKPKDSDERNCFFDLCFPKGLSVNDHVDRSVFNDNEFSLKFTSVDNILSDILNLKEPVSGMWF